MAATKKTTAPKEAQKQGALSVQVRIDRLCDYEGSSIRAFASANIGNAFAIHGIRVVDLQKGLFVSMPQSSYTDADGNKKYSDIFHAITADARGELNDKVLAAYEQAQEEAQSEAETEAEDEDHSMAQSV